MRRGTEAQRPSAGNTQDSAPAAGTGPGGRALKRDRLPLVAAAILLIGGLAFAVVSLSWPLGWDHGALAWVGDTVLRGGYPYHDAYDTSGPAGYLPFVLGQAVFGPQAWGIRAFDLLALVLVAIPLWSALVRLDQRRAVPLALGLLVVWYFSQGYSNTARPDAWAALLGALVTCLFLGRARPPSFRTALAAGTGIGLAALMQPLYLVFALILVAGMVLDERLPGRDRAGLVLLGFASMLVVLGAAGAVLHAGGALREWLSEVIGASVTAASSNGYAFAESTRGFARHFRQGWMLLALPAALAGFVALLPTHKLDAAILAFWLGAALIVPAALGRWEGSDMHAAHTALAVLAGIGILGAWTSSSGPARALLGVFVAMLVLVSVRFVVPPVRDWARWKFGQETEADYARHFEGVDRDYSYRSGALIAEYIARYSEPDDHVLAVENPLINYLSGRAAPGRFVSPWSGWAVELPFDETRRREFDASVVDGQPLWVVLGPPVETSDSLVGGVPAGPSITPALAEALRTRYRMTAHCEDYFLFRRVSPDSARAAPAVAADGPGPSCATLAGA